MDHHADLAPLAFLIGTWSGTGTGVYPTIESFEYREEITFAPLGPKPVMTYNQKTWAVSDGRPLHVETGYLRPNGSDRVEAIIAQPTGITEVSVGSIEDTTMHVRSESVVLAPTAREVRTVERRLEVTDGVLHNQLWMGAVGQEHQIHLTATLGAGGRDR